MDKDCRSYKLSYPKIKAEMANKKPKLLKKKFKASDSHAGLVRKIINCNNKNILNFSGVFLTLKDHLSLRSKISFNINNILPWDPYCFRLEQ